MNKLSFVAAAGLLAACCIPAHAQNAQRGQKLFEECAACHSLKAGESGVGPSLNGVVGRKAGDNPDFRYSPAMKRSGITWNQSTLNEFIADPQKRVPDNRMPYSGLADAASRADLIAYLMSAAK